MLKFIFAMFIIACVVLVSWSLLVTKAPQVQREIVNIGGYGITGLAIILVVVGYGTYRMVRS